MVPELVYFILEKELINFSEKAPRVLFTKAFRR